jgi:hypothetical protein
MDNDEIRKWGAEWVGYRPASTDPNRDRGWFYPTGGYQSDLPDDAYLCEQVRVKWVSDPRCAHAKKHAEMSRESKNAVADWLSTGPMAFIATIRKVIVNG